MHSAGQQTAPPAAGKDRCHYHPAATINPATRSRSGQTCSTSALAEFFIFLLRDALWT